MRGTGPRRQRGIVPTRPIGIWETASARNSGGTDRSFPFHSIQPGQIVFTVMPNEPHSRAMLRE
jgi:hypothetical protein